jgi:hypothetical protein
MSFACSYSRLSIFCAIFSTSAASACGITATPVGDDDITGVHFYPTAHNRDIRAQRFKAAQSRAR